MQPEQIAAGLLDASLPQAEWTHHGHLTAAHVLISTHGPGTTLALCRERIPLLNDAHGVPNSDTSGYHETLSVFFVAAVADAIERGLTIDETIAEHLALPPVKIHCSILAEDAIKAARK